LALARMADGSNTALLSVVLRYNATAGEFQTFQEIPTFRATGWKHFELGGAHFLAVANNRDSPTDYATDSALYRYDEAAGQFRQVDRVPTVGAFGLEHFTLRDGRSFVAVACMRNDTSYQQVSAVYQLNDFCLA